MNPRTVLSITLLSVVSFLCSQPPLPAQADEIRRAVFAGKFYPASAPDLRELLEGYGAAAEKNGLRIPEGKTLKALILPHAGYRYCGFTACHGACLLKGSSFTRVVVMGPDHCIGFKGAHLGGADAFETPLGIVRVHPDARRLRQGHDFFRVVAASDTCEHSIEVVIPLIQTYLPGISLIPIVMGPWDIGAYAAALGAVIDEDTLIVASSDLSHFLPYDEAMERDRETIDMIVNLREDSLASGDNRACGMVPILVLLDLARNRGWEAMLLHYTNSGDTAGARDSVVGYAAIAFYGGPMKKSFSDEQGLALVRLARHTIEKRLGLEPREPESGLEKLDDDILKEKHGVFVTLNKQGDLRGCIGSLEARESVLEGVKHNAINAAFHDPRFRPVDRSEVGALEIEVSILTDPELLEYRDHKDLLKKLRPGVDGVIIRSGYAGATFLPQVWEQLPDKEAFLDHLCAKAGLPANAWKTKKLEVSTYQVQYFEEPR